MTLGPTLVTTRHGRCYGLLSHWFVLLVGRIWYFLWLASLFSEMKFSLSHFALLAFIRRPSTVHRRRYFLLSLCLVMWACSKGRVRPPLGHCLVGLACTFRFGLSWPLISWGCVLVLFQLWIWWLLVVL